MNESGRENLTEQYARRTKENREARQQQEEYPITDSSSEREWNRFAIIGFCLAIVSLFYTAGILIPLAALVLCVIAVVRTDPGRESGKGLAAAGIVISLITLFLAYFKAAVLSGIFRMILNMIRSA